MKTDIFYFSGTGNSLKVARDILQQVKDGQVIAIPKVISQDSITTNADRVGIVFPVYMFGAPLIVVDFLRKLKLNQGQYIFAVVTYGGLAGGTLQQIERELARKGLKLSAGFGIAMPGNYTPLYGAKPLAVQNKMFEREYSKVKAISDIIEAGRPYPVEKGNFLINLIFSGLLYNSCSSSIPKMDRSFWVENTCTGCQVCVKVCPVGNIKLADAKPVWLGRCQQCLACLHWCPEEAIQFGRKTIGRKRYRMPQIQLNDLLKD